jgi:hypothetical protein
MRRPFGRGGRQENHRELAGFLSKLSCRGPKTFYSMSSFFDPW